MWRQRCSSRRRDGKEQERGSVLSALQDRKENAMMELG